jgi:hypothetical protein
LIGGHFTGWLLWILVASGWLLVTYRHLVTLSPRHLVTLSPCHPFTRSPAHPLKNWHKDHTLLLLLLAVGLTLRLLAVRDIAFPPWVDSVRHGVITAVMSQSGQTITQTGYEPFLPVDRFPYHFGFHTLSSSLVLMTGWAIPRLLLALGQLLNALLPLTVYAGGWLLTRQRRAGLLAAFLVTLPLFFPAYYATWGRYTQLTAMLLMPVLLGLTWRLVRGAKGWRGTWWLLALLVGGLFLVHFRVFVFFLPFVGLVWLLSWGRNGRSLWLAAALSVFILLPQLIYLFQSSDPGSALAARQPDYTAFPTAYYTAGWDRLFLWLAGGLLLPVLLLWLWRRRRWTAVPLLVALWGGVVLLLLSGNYLGFPALPLVNLNSYYITTFLPLALFLGTWGPSSGAGCGGSRVFGSLPGFCCWRWGERPLPSSASGSSSPSSTSKRCWCSPPTPTPWPGWTPTCPPMPPWRSTAGFGCSAPGPAAMAGRGWCRSPGEPAARRPPTTSTAVSWPILCAGLTRQPRPFPIGARRKPLPGCANRA